jgi:hypothetical protein
MALKTAFNYVTIVPEENIHGHCRGLAYRGGERMEMDVYDRNGRARDWIEKRVKGLLAGNVAERLATGRKINVGAQHDFSTACDLLSHLCGHGNGEIEAYFNLLMIRTRGILTSPPIWSAVERLAAELLNKQTVRYKSAKTLFIQAREDFYRLPDNKRRRLWDEAATLRAKGAGN